MDEDDDPKDEEDNDDKKQNYNKRYSLSEKLKYTLVNKSMFIVFEKKYLFLLWICVGSAWERMDWILLLLRSKDKSHQQSYIYLPQISGLFLYLQMLQHGKIAKIINILRDKNEIFWNDL